MIQVFPNVGSMRHRVQLVNVSAGARQQFGDSVATATPFATVWARVAALSGKDLYQAQQFVSQVSHQVTIRFGPTVVAGNAVVFGTRSFRVQAVLNPEERNIVLNLLCLEINDGQVNVPDTTT